MFGRPHRPHITYIVVATDNTQNASILGAFSRLDLAENTAETWHAIINRTMADKYTMTVIAYIEDVQVDRVQKIAAALGKETDA